MVNGKFYVMYILPPLGFPGSSAGKESPSMQETLVQFLGQEDLLQKEQATHSQYSWASLVAQMVKNPPAKAGDVGSIRGSEKSPGCLQGSPMFRPEGRNGT